MSLAEEIVEKVCGVSMGPNEPLDATAEVAQFQDGDGQNNDDPDLLGAAAADDLDEVNDNLSEFVDDNVSLEVNFGDGGSCRASDVSSLSFQNIVLDNPETVQYQESIGIRYRRDSLSESSTSPQNEFADTADFDNRLEDDLESRPVLSPGYDNVDMATGSETDEINTGTMKRRTKMSCEPDGKNCSGDMCPTNNGGGGCSGGGMCSATNSTNIYTPCSHRPSHDPLQENGSQKSSEWDATSGKQAVSHLQHPLVSMSGNVSDGDFSKTDLLLRSPDEELASRDTTLKKRNSLEVRNNIPNVNEVKNYGETPAVTSMVTSNMLVQAVMPKMKKKSPGLARRLPDAVAEFMDRDSSSSERDDQPPDVAIVSAPNYFDQPCQNGSGPAGYVPPLVSSDAIDRRTMGDADQARLDLAALEESIDVENEYDYVKYARIQQGSSYVGMRLAYSNNSVNHSNTPNGQAGYPLDMSRETSPAKQTGQLVAPPSNGLGSIAGMLNEDLLTEISLTGSSDQAQSEEHKQFTLSPEATECDSAEVESVISEEGKSSSLSGMPAVEDGLSSSQTSDVEETLAHEAIPQPADILKQRCKAGVDLQQQLADGKEPPSPYHEETFGRRRRALDSAIRDIQSAIERSKTAQPEGMSEQPQVVEDDPVWVKRDNFAPKPNNQEALRKAHTALERQKEDMYREQEAEKVYRVEDEDESLLQYQYTRNDGKVYRAPKGYDSDDESTEHDRHLVAHTRRRNKGKRYVAVASDDPVDYAYFKAVSDRYHGHSDERRPQEQSPQMSKSDPNLNRECYPGGAVAVSAIPYTDNVNDDRNGSRSSQHSGRQHGNFPESPSMGGTRSVSSGDIAGERHAQQYRGSCSDQSRSSEDVGKVNTYIRQVADGEYDSEDEETEDLLDKQYGGSGTVDIPELSRPPVNRSSQAEKRRSKTREVLINDPDDHTVLIEGVLFRARYLGSTQLISDGHPSKSMRMMQAQEAVGRIKAPAGEAQPSTEVDLFVSTEKIMILNTDLQEVMMDHSLRTISYIADIGDILVVMARRGPVISTGADGRIHQKRQSKICCHVFESDEAQLIAQSIGQAFQVAYMEFLKANGIDDPSLIKEIDYQEVLNQQEIYGEELYLFSNKDMQKEVIVPKLKGEPLGIVIVESGWGSMVPTVVLANMCPQGAAARCGQLNIGDQIMSVNGISLVGLPLSSCQTYMKTARNQTVVKLTTVSCPPVVEVLIKRPDVKYQLGFSVQNGVICSLLRGGIAERGGVRVGHRIIEINAQSVVAVPHEKIVTMLATSVGEIHMKTMPTSIFRLLTGQDTPHYI